jgi:hypothetical protein
MRISVYDIASRVVYPALRRGLVENLLSIGLSRGEISKLLNITPSAVTRYIKGERGVVIDLVEIPWVRESLNNLAMEIVREETPTLKIEEELVRLTVGVLANKELCNYHSKIDLSIDPLKCNICPSIFGPIISSR